MTAARELQTPAKPEAADEPRALRVAGASGVEQLQRTIGNRAVGSLLRRQALARKLGGAPREGQLIQGEGQIYEIIRSDFDKSLNEWKYKVKGADGKEKTVGDWDTSYDFTSATQVIEAAIAKKTGDWRTVIDSLPEARVNELAGFHAWLDKIAPQVSEWRFAYLAAAIMINSKHAPVARKEARRQISAELGDKDVAMRMIKKPVSAVIVPRDKQMTELPEFASLATDDSGAGPGKTFDGREWAHVRGVGDVRVGTKVYAAITEENLLGGDPDPKVFAEKKDAHGTVTVPAGPAQGGYTAGYSTTTHEFAHVLHRHGLSDADKAVITKAYQDRRAASSGSKTKLTKKWVDGPRVSPTAPKNWKDAGWTDAKWLKHLNSLSDDARRPFECYASQSEEEYFAQLSNAYLGTNLGSDATTGKARHNGRAWVKAHEPKEMLDLLDRLYQHKTVNDITAGGKLKKGGKCANPPKPPPVPPGPAPKGGT